MKEPIFLTLAEVIELHKMLLAKFGGLPGIRDLGLLISAIEIPKVTFGGEFLHKNLYSMAAAYIFHICKNHPFVDGNKRIALLTGLTFLALNGIKANYKSIDLYQATMKIADGSVDKNEIEKFLKNTRQ